MKSINTRIIARTEGCIYSMPDIKSHKPGWLATQVRVCTCHPSTCCSTAPVCAPQKTRYRGFLYGGNKSCPYALQDGLTSKLREVQRGHIEGEGEDGNVCCWNWPRQGC